MQCLRGEVWDGLDNAAWGSHVYYENVKHFDRAVRDAKGDTFYARPMTLTKCGQARNPLSQSA